MTAAVLAALTCCIVSVAPASASRVPVGQALVVLLQNHIARTAPSGNARSIESIASRTPLTGVRTVLPVLAQPPTTDGPGWT